MKPALARVLRAAIGLAAVALLGAAGWAGYGLLARQPIAQVRFTQDVARLPAAQLDRLAAGLRGREVALPSVREAVRRLPWVRDCVVRRVFPATLVVAIETHSVLARWDETRLVSERGEVFTADDERILPRFVGPEGKAADMAAAWPGLVNAAAPLGSPIVEIRLSERQAWQARLASGLTLELGRGEVQARLARFAAVQPYIGEQAGKATHADLRYPNGFALRGVPAEGGKAAPAGRAS